MTAKYTPLRFLGALGNGGMVVTFFMYLNFLVPHKTTPIIDFNSWFHMMKDSSMIVRILIPLALLGVLIFSGRHIYYLINNLQMYRKQKLSKDEKEKIGKELMAIPLTLAMTVNVGFMCGSLFVPNLWNYTEFLFPPAALAFTIIGLFAFKIFLGCFSHRILHGEENASFNNLSRLIPVFSFSMVAVGLAAPAAMSHLKVTASISALLAIFFISTALFLGLIQLVSGFNEMIKKGISREASATIWIMIPIMTILGIAIVRLAHYFEHNIGFQDAPTFDFVLLTSIFSVQILLGLIGFVVMKKNGYFDDYVKGKSYNYGTYALICPGVAFFVLGIFLISIALVKTGIVDKYSVTHISLIALLALIQLKTIRTIFVLDRKLM